MRVRLWPDSIFGRFLAVLLVSCALAQLVATTLVIQRGGSLIVRREYSLLDQAAKRVSDILARIGTLPPDDRHSALLSLAGREIAIDLTRGTPPFPPPPGSLPPLMQLSRGVPAVRRMPELESRADELVRRVQDRVGTEVGLTATILSPRAMAYSQLIGNAGVAQQPHITASRESAVHVWPEAGVPQTRAVLPSPGPSATVIRDPEMRLIASWPGEPPLAFRIASGATLVRREPLYFNVLGGLQLAGQLLVLFVGVGLGAYVAARRITNPLSRLAVAVDSLGRSLSQPPLPETGPRELRQVAQGFNVMQDRLKRYVDSRTRVVAAMSHDLRTPLTRVRLRLEMMEEGEQRQEFERDLAEMESMVLSTLDALSDLGADEAVRSIDVNELLLRLQVEFAQLGQALRIEGVANALYPAKPQSLKRCLTNLIGNAFKYGDEARVRVTDDSWLRIEICDRGPGIPPAELERVFEPFYRLESSRSRETGGAGLGLSVARDCAQAHGGRLTLRNRSEGGLCAELSLPRGATTIA